MTRSQIESGIVLDVQPWYTAHSPSSMSRGHSHYTYVQHRTQRKRQLAPMLAACLIVIRLDAFNACVEILEKQASLHVRNIAFTVYQDRI